MKYCTICKINVEEHLDNCPLCGSFLSNESPLPYENYEKNIQPYVKYPTIHPNILPDFWKNRISKVLMLVVAVCFALDLIIEPYGLQWAAYVLLGSIVFLGCIHLPIIKKTRLHNQVMLDLPVLIFVSLGFELCITSFTSAALSLSWVIPSLLAASVVCSDLLIIFKNKKEVSGYFSTLLFCTVFIVIFQLVLWIFGSLNQRENLYSQIVFFGGLLNLSVVVICCFRSLKAEYSRKLNM